MSLFTKPISQLVTSDLQELLQDGAVENARLEFKLEVPGRDDSLKKISSFANTFGGHMTVGAQTKSADGRIEELACGGKQDGEKKKNVDWGFGAVTPPAVPPISDCIPCP